MGEYDSQRSTAAPTYAGPVCTAAQPAGSQEPFEPLQRRVETTRPSVAPAPTWSPVSQEAAIHAIASSSGAWELKRAQFAAILFQLPPADAHQLRRRLQCADASDPVASQLPREHRDELVVLLDEPHRAPAPAPVAPATLDTEVRLREALVADRMDDVIAALVVMDASHRQLLLARVERYRQGNGDDIASRIVRLDELRKLVVLRVLKEPVVAPKPPRVAVAHYLDTHATRLEIALETHLQTLTWPLPPQLVLHAPKLFARAIATRVAVPSVERLEVLLYPVDVVGELARRIPASGDAPEAEARYLQLAQNAVLPSAARMMRRYADALERGALTVDDLGPASPIDAVVAAGLVEDGVIQRVGGAQPAAKRAAPRPVSLSFEGQRDRRLWQWVRADRIDATPEEVSAKLYAHVPEAPSSFAYGLACAPPLFGLPATWAIAIPELKAFAPTAKLPEPAQDSIERRLATLALSAVADSLAAQEAPKISADVEAVRSAVEDIGIQLVSLRDKLVPWKLDHELLLHIGRAANKLAELRAAAPHEVAAYAGVAFAQRGRLRRVSAVLGPLLAAANGSGQPRGEAHPMYALVREVAIAAATAQLASSDGLIAEVEQRAQGLAIQALQANQLALVQAVGALAPGTPNDTKEADETRTSSDGLRAESRTLENQLLLGKAVDADELARVELESAELALRADLISTRGALVRIEEADHAAASKGLDGLLVKMGLKYSSIELFARDVRSVLVAIDADLTGDQRHAKPRAGDADGLKPDALDVQVRRTAVARAQGRLASLRHDRELEGFLRGAYQLIEVRQFKDAIINFAILMGINLLTAGAATAVEGGLTGMFMTSEGVAAATELSIGARVAIGVAKLTTEAVVNTAAQVAVTGADADRALAENFIFSFGFSGATLAVSERKAVARAMRSSLGEQVKLLADAERRVGAVRSVGHAALTVSGHAVMGLALSALADRILDGEKAQGGPSSLDATLQFANVAIGRLVHASTVEHQSALHELAKQVPAAHGLLAEAAKLAANSEALTKIGRASLALDVLDQHRAFVDHYLVAIERALEHTSDPALRAKLQARAGELRGNASDARDYTMIALQFHLVGLEELAPGELYSGRPDQIDRAVRDVARARPGVVVERMHDDARFEIDGHPFELVARGGVAPALERTHELSMRVGAVHGSTPAPTNDVARPTLVHDATMSVQVPGVIAREQVDAVTYLFQLADQSWTSIDVTFARVDAGEPARLVPNSSRHVKLGGREVRGEHTLQLSNALPKEEVDRVIAHGVARLIAMHERALAGNYPGHDLGVLTPDDVGRVAEIDVLARKIHGGDAAARAHAEDELVVLVQYLGLKDDAKRRAAALQWLPDSGFARHELNKAIAREPTHAQRDAAIADLDRERAVEVAQHPPHDAPHAMGRRVSLDELKALADIAARHRALVSARTLDKYRALAAHDGKPPAIPSVQIGAGAALAGRNEHELLVDARGRWQADGSFAIAQVGQQLQEAFGARFGDVREFVNADERVRLQAVQYWEDSIASQGEVIDGMGTLRQVGERSYIDIVPTNGGVALTLEISGAVTQSSGFPDERFLGGVFQMSPSNAVLQIDRGLRTALSDHPEMADRIASAQRAIASVPGGRDADLELVRRAIEGIPREWLGDGAVAALQHLDARGRFEQLQVEDAKDGKKQLYTGKDANDARIIEQIKVRDLPDQRIVFAGGGGSAVSAAEIILENTKYLHVELVAGNQPDGLFENVQFRGMCERWGDEGIEEMAKKNNVVLRFKRDDARLHLQVTHDLRLVLPELEEVDGKQRFALRRQGADANVYRGETKERIVGDVIISALGSPGQLPPEIASLALRARRADPSKDIDGSINAPVKVHADFTADGRYIGYTAYIRFGSKTRAFHVRGAASRYGFLPADEFERMPEGRAELERIKTASREDAPTKGGNFDAGMNATNMQTSHQHMSRESK